MTPELDAKLEELALQRESKDDPFRITWRDDNASHPRNWPLRRRVFESAVILFVQLFTTLMSTSGTSLGLAAKEEYGLTRTVSLVVFVLTYQLGRLGGSILLPPLTEAFGRKATYIATSFISSIMCLIVGVVPNVAGAIVGRIFSGTMGAAGGCVAAGSMQDLYDVEARVWGIFMWTVVSVGGLTLGPIYGSYLAQALGWRWGFYIAAIIMFSACMVCFTIRESRPSRILRRKVDELRRTTGIEKLYCETADDLPDLRTFGSKHLLRPLFFFATEPIVTAVIIMCAIVWSLLFLFTESLTIIYGLYGFTDVQSSLFFIPIMIGIFASTIVRLHDRRLLAQRNKQGQTVKPEDKLFGFVIGAPALAIGLWWFAWTTPQAVHTHWIAPSIALVLVGFAITEFEYVLSGYLADCYLQYSASAIGSIAIIRAAFAGSLPLFAYYMFTGISTNAASSILAVVATLFCIVPYVFIRYGERLRAKSPFARESVRLPDR